jgi:putative OPT family oligopeptide transporter
MAIVVNVTICLAATTSQDLKTGYIVGATPRSQQLAEILGVFLPAIAIAGTITLLSQTYGFGSKELPAPQGTMMALIAKGVIERSIPFTLVSIGVVFALLLELMKIPILAFAVGLYLPLSLSTPIMLGGVVAYFIRKMSKKEDVYERGILTSSGLVAGDACMGVVIALLSVTGWVNLDKPPLLPDLLGMSIFLLLAGGLAWFTLRPPKKWS